MENLRGVEHRALLSFFTKKSNPQLDFSVLGTDLHSHLIPGIDDGSPDLETSVMLIKEMGNLGYKKIITTPHVMGEYYPNSSESILSGLENVREAIATANIPVEIYAAAEYNADENFNRLIREDDLLTMPGKKLLFELSLTGEDHGIHQIVFNLRVKGYNLILAHVERYPYFHGAMTAIERFKEGGCALQVNILSLVGHYGRPVKKWAEKLLKAGMIDYLGTDLHHPGHLQLLKKHLPGKQIQHVLQTYAFKNKEL